MFNANEYLSGLGRGASASPDGGSSSRASLAPALRAGEGAVLDAVAVGHLAPELRAGQTLAIRLAPPRAPARQTGAGTVLKVRASAGQPALRALWTPKVPLLPQRCCVA